MGEKKSIYEKERKTHPVRPNPGFKATYTPAVSRAFAVTSEQQTIIIAAVLLIKHCPFRKVGGPSETSLHVFNALVIC